MNKKLIKAYAKKLSVERGCRVTLADSESEIVRVMTKVAKSIGPTYRFGYHSNEDMTQEGIKFAIIILDKNKYDINQPLENFLHVCIHNQLYNFKRKHYARLETPCDCCDPTQPPAYPCQKFIDWRVRNSAKQNLMTPLDMSNISDEYEAGMKRQPQAIDDALSSELRTLIDTELPIEFRREYLQMLDGKVIPKARRQIIQQTILAIIQKRGYLDASETESDQNR